MPHAMMTRSKSRAAAEDAKWKPCCYCESDANDRCDDCHDPLCDMCKDDDEQTHRVDKGRRLVCGGCYNEGDYDNDDDDDESENEDTMCKRCGKNPRQVPPEDCEFPGDYTICEICEESSECPLCDAITGGKSWFNGNTCCVCQEITLCDACCPVIEGGHGDRCWSECIEEGYEHKICLRCEEEMLKPV